jgi:hypothetical protein
MRRMRTRMGMGMAFRTGAFFWSWLKLGTDILSL